MFASWVSFCESSGGGESRVGGEAEGRLACCPIEQLLRREGDLPLMEPGALAALWPTWLTSSGIPRALSISSRPSKFRKAKYSWSRSAPSSLGDSAAGCGHSRSSGELPNGCLQRDKLHHGLMEMLVDIQGLRNKLFFQLSNEPNEAF